MIMQVMIMIMQDRERNKTQEAQVLHKTTAHHTLINAQPAPEQQCTHPRQLLSAYVPGMTLHSMNIPLASSSQQSWLCFFPTPCTPAQWHSTGNFEVLG